VSDRYSRRYEMRRIILVLGFCCLLAGPAWAGGGFSFFGAYSEITEDDPSIGAGARLSLGGESLVFDLTATWLAQSATIVLRETGSPVTDELTITPIEIGGRYLFSAGSVFRWYLGLGGSYFLVDLNGGKTENEIGFYALGGFVYGADNNVQLFTEVTYRQADVTLDYGSAGSEDLTVGGFGVNAGLTIRF
jgi:hypothetical protein